MDYAPEKLITGLAREGTQTPAKTGELFGTAEEREEP